MDWEASNLKLIGSTDFTRCKMVHINNKLRRSIGETKANIPSEIKHHEIIIFIVVCYQYTVGGGVMLYFSERVECYRELREYSCILSLSMAHFIGSSFESYWPHRMKLRITETIYKQSHYKAVDTGK